MGRQAKFLNKIVSLIVSITFLITQFVVDIKPAYSALPPELPLPLVNEITIPEAYGKITEVFKGDSDKLVFHIQDLHTNPEAQLNASKIMEYLIDTYGIKLLTIEGEAGLIDPEWLANVSLIKIINDKMAEIFLNSGEMTGEEYLYVTKYPKYKDVVFRGIEDKDSYWKNREVFNRMYPRIRENMRLCDNIKGSLDRLKKAIYPEAAVELDEKRASYEERELEVKDYTSYLIGIAKEKDIDLSKYENFSILSKLVEIQERLEFSKVDKERTLLFDGLSKALSEDEAKAMMEKVKEHNEGKLTAIEFYTYLKELATNNDIDFTQYSNIITYMEYISTSDKLDNTHLFKELEQVEDAITEAYLTTDEQRQLARLSKNLSIMKKFFDINLSNEDLDYYQKNKGEFKIQAFIDFIKEKAKQHNVRISTDPSLSQLDKTLLEQDEFYKVVLVRDEAMVQNTIKRMEEFNANITIQPIGGFHTKGMAKMYKEQGISYVVISPHVTKEFDEENYRNILQNKKKPVKELMEEFSKTLRPEEMSGKKGAQVDAVAAAVYIARDIFEKRGMTEEEALRAALETVNPEFAKVNADKLPEDLKGVVWPALRSGRYRIGFNDLSQAERDYLKGIGVTDTDNILFEGGLGFAGLAIFDEKEGKVVVSRWWLFAGMAYNRFDASKGQLMGRVIANAINDHDLEHLNSPQAPEEAIYGKQADKLLDKGKYPPELRLAMADFIEQELVPNAERGGTQPAKQMRAYVNFLRASASDFVVGEQNMRETLISDVANASREVAQTYVAEVQQERLTRLAAPIFIASSAMAARSLIPALKQLVRALRGKAKKHGLVGIPDLIGDEDASKFLGSRLERLEPKLQQGTVNENVVTYSSAVGTGITTTMTSRAVLYEKVAQADLQEFGNLSRLAVNHALFQEDFYAQAQDSEENGVPAEFTGGKKWIDVSLLFTADGKVRAVNPTGYLLGTTREALRNAGAKEVLLINTRGLDKQTLETWVINQLGLQSGDGITVTAGSVVELGDKAESGDDIAYDLANETQIRSIIDKIAPGRRAAVNIKEGDTYSSFAISLIWAKNASDIQANLKAVAPDIKEITSREDGVNVYAPTTEYGINSKVAKWALELIQR